MSKNTILPHRTIAFAKKKTFYAGLKVFNSLSEEIKNHNLTTMKKVFWTWLQNRAFYALTQFFSWRGGNNNKNSKVLKSLYVKWRPTILKNMLIRNFVYCSCAFFEFQCTLAKPAFYLFFKVFSESSTYFFQFYDCVFP